MTKLYYEAHVTIEPVFDANRDFAGQIAKAFKFKLADLLMRKRSEDSEERSKNDTFMTGHSTDYEDIKQRTISLVKQLQSYGYKVWRYKIEDTLVDSRSADEFGLLV